MGGVNFCLGLTKEDREYVPSSALLEIFKKDADSEIYESVKHVAKGLNLNNIRLPEEISCMIDLKNYVYKGK